MTPEQFVYWLQGYAELQIGNDEISLDQWKMIKDHLKEVFHKVTPTYLPIPNHDQQKLPPMIPPPYPWQQPGPIC